MTTHRSRIATLRHHCLAEALTLLVLLFVAVPLKHLAGQPAAVAVMGPVHGLAFLALGWRIVEAVVGQDIPRRTAWRLMAAACVPFGGLHGWATLRPRDVTA